MALAVSLAFALTACAAPPAVPEVTSAPSDAPVDDAADALAQPQTALALTCEQLFSEAEVQEVIESSALLRRDESSAPLGVRGATLAQAGASLCEYGGESRTDGSYDQGIRLQAVPQAAEAFDAYLDAATFSATARMNTIGDRSVLDCQGTAAQYQCWADFVVGDYWVNARFSDRSAIGPDAAADLATAALTTVASRIEDGGAERPLWEPPASADPALLCSDPAASAALLAESAASLTVADASFVEQGVPIFACTWTGGSGAQVGIIALAGGAWGWNDVAGTIHMEFDDWGADSTAVDVPGTDGTLVICTDLCSALVSWKGTLIQVSFVEPSYDFQTAGQRLLPWAAALP